MQAHIPTDGLVIESKGAEGREHLPSQYQSEKHAYVPLNTAPYKVLGGDCNLGCVKGLVT